MKIITKIFILAFCLSLFASCKTFNQPNVETENQQKIIKAENRLNSTSDRINVNDKAKENETSILASGIQYSLSKVETPSNQVKTAQKLNDRIVSIVGTPNLDDSEKIKRTVDLLNSVVQTEKNKGQAALKIKDVQIVALQEQHDFLKKQYTANVINMADQAKSMAEQADANQSVIDSVNKWFGLGAVFYGLKTFIKSAFVGLLIFGTIFLVLRVFASTNPAVGAIFAVFDIIGGWFMNFIRVLTPNAHKIAKVVDTVYFNKYQKTLKKIVKIIQRIKEKEVDGNGDTKVSIKEIRSYLSQIFDEEDNDLIRDIKKSI